MTEQHCTVHYYHSSESLLGLECINKAERALLCFILLLQCDFHAKQSERAKQAPPLICTLWWPVSPVMGLHESDFNAHTWLGWELPEMSKNKIIPNSVLNTKYIFNSFSAKVHEIKKKKKHYLHAHISPKFECGHDGHLTTSTISWMSRHDISIKAS